MNRIVGLETEYGCLTSDPSGPTPVVGRVRNWIFDKNRFGLADLHQRDWEEPAGNGGFLFNGGRAYVDMGHLEYCTPECLSLRDLVLYDQAGDAILRQAVRDLHLVEQVGFVRNNVDHYSGATFGCHENYLVRRTAPVNEANVLSLLAFLTLRVLYCGAGRVGATPGAELRGDPGRAGTDGGFQISQRADYINNDLFEWVQFNRAIINTRDEPLADARRYRRLHLLHGDTNVLPSSLVLKVGTTALVLDLLDLDRLPRVVLSDAVLAFRTVSHQTEGPWRVALADGRQVDAVELLASYHEAAEREFRNRDAETDAVLRLWGEALAGLSTCPDKLVGRVDWITKRWLFAQFVDQEGIAWSDPWLKAQDLEFHHLDPHRNLGWAVARTPPEWEMGAGELQTALREAPGNTRAHARSRIMRLLKDRHIRYFVDWEVVDAEGGNSLPLLNPFDAEPPELEPWARGLNLL